MLLGLKLGSAWERSEDSRSTGHHHTSEEAVCVGGGEGRGGADTGLAGWMNQPHGVLESLPGWGWGGTCNALGSFPQRVGKVSQPPVQIPGNPCSVST